MPRTPPHPTRRLAASLGAATVVVVGACSTSTGPAPIPPPAASASSSAPSGDLIYPLAVSSTRGDVTIPARPRKILAMGAGSLDMVTSLGVRPAAFTSGMAPLPSYLKMSGLNPDTALGTVDDASAPNIDKITAMHPDLIVAAEWMAGDPNTYSRLSDVAPVIVSTASWEKDLTTLGRALDRDEEAKQLLRRAHAEVSAVRAKSTVAGRSMLDCSYVKKTFVCFEGGLWSMLYGLKTSKRIEWPGVSLATLASLDPDVLFIEPSSDTEEIESDSRWRGLSAVRTRHLIRVDTDLGTATTDIGPRGLHYAITRTSPLLARR